MSELALAIQKDAEEKLKTVTVALGPVLSRSFMSDDVMRSFRSLGEAMSTISVPMQRMTEEIAKISEPYIRFQQQMNEAVEAHKRLFESFSAPTIPRELFIEREPVRYVPEYQQRPTKVTVELSEKHCEMIGNSVATALIERGVTIQVHHTSAQIDLTYNRQEHTLTRRVGTMERTTRFDGKEDNKRRELFEKLARATRGIATDELKEYLDCPSIDATYKVIQGLNKKIADDLSLTMNIADGSDKGGYRINSQIAVHVV
jgi:hypothetical protein